MTKAKHRICLVTGANRGIGLALAKGMAQSGYHVVMLCRSASSGEAAMQSLLDGQADASVSLMLCDLSSQSSMRAFVDAFAATYDRLDVLLNNAAILPFRREETEDGLEMVFAVNYFAAFFLSSLLLEQLRVAAPSRIVNVVGRLHHKGKIQLDDLQLTRGYHTLKAGTQAVLAKTILTYEQDRRYRDLGIRANCFHPGNVDTDMARHAPGWIRWFAGLLKPWKVTPEEGAAPGIWLATAPEIEGKGGLYYDRMTPSVSSEASRDPVLGNQLWEASDAMLKHSFHFPKQHK